MPKLIRYLLIGLIGVTGLLGFSFHLESNPELTEWLAGFGATRASWLKVTWTIGNGLSANINPNWTMAAAFVCCVSLALYRWTGRSKATTESQSDR